MKGLKGQKGNGFTFSRVYLVGEGRQPPSHYLCSEGLEPSSHTPRPRFLGDAAPQISPSIDNSIISPGRLQPLRAFCQIVVRSAITEHTSLGQPLGNRTRFLITQNMNGKLQACLPRRSSKGFHTVLPSCVCVVDSCLMLLWGTLDSMQNSPAGCSSDLPTISYYSNFQN